MEKRRGRVCAVEITHRYRTECMHVAVECVSEKNTPGEAEAVVVQGQRS